MTHLLLHKTPNSVSSEPGAAHIVRFVKDDEPIEEKMQAVTNPVQYLKLHGCLDHIFDNDIPLVLSREQYSSYLKNRTRLFDRLKYLAPESVIIFVGYRLDDGHIRDLIYSLAPNKRPRWYMVNPEAESYDVDFWASKNVSPPRETGGGFFMSKRKSGDHAAESPSPPEIVCILVVDAIIDEFEVEICCQRTDGVDRVFSTSMDWLRAERPYVRGVRSPFRSLRKIVAKYHQVLGVNRAIEAVDQIGENRGRLGVLPSSPAGREAERQ